MNKKDFWSGLLTGILIAAFIVSAVLCGKVIYNATQDAKQSETASNVGAEESAVPEEYESVLEDPELMEKILLLENAIDELYIGDVSTEDIKNGIYDGIMSSLGDPYAAYYTPEEWIELQNSTAGIYFGIGAYLQKSMTTLYPQITGIIDDSPASESELRVDDYIYMVDGEDVYDMDLSEVVSMIKGEEGTTVTLTIVRPSTGEELDVTLERRRVESPTVTYEMLEDDILLVTITEFDTVTVDQFAEALAIGKGSGMQGMILDLRGNPGGSLAAVVEIARMILPEGLIVYTEDNYGERVEYACDGTHELDVPMVVLVNGGSASASEILAGAIKDYEMGILVGTTTFGKGIVQRVVALDDGSAVKLTVSHYYTPLGNDIHEVGISPDVEIEFDSEAYLEDETDNQLDEAIAILLDEIG